MPNPTNPPTPPQRFEGVDIQNVTELGDYLRAEQAADRPKAWKDIPPVERGIAMQALMPAKGFNEQQKAYLRRWWLECTQADVDAINAALPASVRVEPITQGGKLFICGDLLTDAIEPGSTYGAALAVIESLPCIYMDYTPPAVENQ